MDRGTYISASAGLLQLRKIELINNNLANVNTVGFKGQSITGDVQSFDQTLAKAVATHDPFAKGDHIRTPGTTNAKVLTDFSPGSIRATGNPLDVALRDPNNFFVVQTPQGQQYTRAGNFSLNANGELVTPDGMQVLGQGGPITANFPGVHIDPDGGVRASGQELGKLQVVRFQDPTKLERAAGARFKQISKGGTPTQVEGEVVPQSLEMANVSALTSVVDLILANRGFELYTKSAQTIDAMNQQAIQQVGKSQ